MTTNGSAGKIPITRHSRALVSVAAALFLFKRRLTDTCVLGNLHKTGTGFGKVLVFDMLERGGNVYT